MKDQEHITEVDQFVIDFIRKLRLEKKMTQEDIANVLHVSRSFIADVESTSDRSKYNIRHLNALADYFNISPRDFLPEKPFPVNPTARPKKTAPPKPAKKAAGKKSAGKAAARPSKK